MKHIILSLFVLSFTVSIADAQVKRKGVTVKTNKKSVVPAQRVNLNDLQGKWLEVKRSSGNNTEVYKDTMQLEISGKNYILKTTADMVMTLKGEVIIESPNTLLLVTDAFKIKSLSSVKMILTQDGTQHQFNKVLNFASDLYGMDSIKTETLQPQQYIDQNLLAGEWEVYKRTGPPGVTDNIPVLVKKITLPVFINNSGKGSATFYNDSNVASEADVEFTINGSRVTAKTGNRVYTYTIYTSTNDSLVFGNEGQVINYAKRL